MLNQIILIGRLTKDPERRGQNSEKPVAVIRLAVDRDFKRDAIRTRTFLTAPCSAIRRNSCWNTAKRVVWCPWWAVCSSASGLTSRQAKSTRSTRFPVRTSSFWTRNRKTLVHLLRRTLPQYCRPRLWQLRLPHRQCIRLHRRHSSRLHSPQ